MLNCVPNNADDACLGVQCASYHGECDDVDGLPQCSCIEDVDLVGDACLPRGIGTWRQLDVPVLPLEGGYSALTWDSLRQVPVLIGGSSLSTWQFHGDGGWVQIIAPVQPPPRVQGAIAFDDRRGRHVLFGGSDPVTFEYFSDTWEFDGETWLQVDASTIPPARRGGAAIYVPQLEQVLLFGGEQHNGANWVTHGDAWLFDGVDWTLLDQPDAPPPMSDPIFVWDAARRVVLLSDGQDTWEFDGASWLWTSSEFWPGAAAYDGSRSRVLGLHSTDTRVFDGQQWWTESGASDLYSIDWHTLGYDWGARRMMLVGYVYGWGGTTWVYEYISYWGAEDCASGDDDDRDGYTNCADPDCEGADCGDGVCSAGVCQ